MIDEITPYSLNVRDHGVIGDGTSDDAPAIQTLLDGPAKLLFFPAGTYLIGRPLRIASNTRIVAHRFAHFRFADGAGRDVNSFMLRNADLDAGNENISIEGGIWDGNRAGNPRGAEDDRQGYTGVLANFRHVRGLTLLDMTLRDPTAYYTRLSGVLGFRIERLRFEVEQHAGNQDGVHIAGCCEDGLVRDITAVGRACTGDDLVALNADDALNRCETRGKLGGPIRRVRVDGLRADDCHSFVRMASVWSPIEDVEINDVRGGCGFCLINADAARFCASPLFRRDDKRYAGGVGLLRRVRIRNVAVYKTGGNTTPLLRLGERMDDFEIEHFERLCAHDVSPEAPTLEVAFQSTDAIALEGIGREDARRCAEESDCARLSLSRLPYTHPDARPFRLEAAVEPAGRFICRCSRFDRFQVSRCRIDALPEPDWNVAKGQYT